MPKLTLGSFCEKFSIRLNGLPGPEWWGGRREAGEVPAVSFWLKGVFGAKERSGREDPGEVKRARICLKGVFGGRMRWDAG